MRWLFAAVCCGALASPVLAWQAGRAVEKRRLYVEPFATKGDAEKLRSALAGEIRKLGAVSLVADASRADLILGGGGEIWIRGYRSLNPRSGRLPANGEPVYAGYLSVELRDLQGVTLWSDLVTPAIGSGDIAKDLSKRIVKHLGEALEQQPAALKTVIPSHAATILNGAGATFPQPVYAKWFMNYRRENPDVELNYRAVGSEEGIRELVAGRVDFGASDNPQAVDEITPGQESKYLLFPSVIGAVVPIVNLPGLPHEIAFTPEALAGIYLGKITKWNDPILKQCNRDFTLPDLNIVVVHRADGSGTSYAWTDYLSKVSPRWKSQVGSRLAPAWPTGRPATGNDGVAKLVKELGGSIGYVEWIYALQNHLSYGRVRNRDGEFVEASLESIAAASRAIELRDNFDVSIVDAPGKGAYPIASLTWLVVPTSIPDENKRHAIATFLVWMLGPGQRQAAALGYLALPKDIVTREERAIAGIH
ncbi:MAG TPA: phosphate ABC transporter substrate-binding protein PstS [Bryobacteraceae bacterium]|nr:phosphate ABC transporter substrate-binding protein PstS [Bryobacteraceae bacterium]